MDETGYVRPPEPEIGDFALIQAVITRPSAAFEQIARKPRFLAPAVMIALGTMIFGWGMGPLMGKLMGGVMSGAATSAQPGAPPVDPAMFGRIFTYVMFCCAPLGGAISWFVWTSVVFVAAMLAGSKGRYWPLFSALGYAWVAYLPAYIIAGIIMYNAGQNFVPPSFPAVQPNASPTPSQAASNAYMVQALASLRGAFLSHFIVIILFSVWNVILCALAVEKIMGLTRSISILVVAVLKFFSLCITVLSNIQVFLPGGNIGNPPGTP